MKSQVLGILLVGLLVRSIIAFKLPPGYDEAYYYLYTQNPAWSFFDHPPMVALTTALGLWVSGDQVSQLTIRVGTLLTHTATLGFLYLAAVRLFGENVGRLTLILASIVPIFLVALVLFPCIDSTMILLLKSRKSLHDYLCNSRVVLAVDHEKEPK